VRNAAAETLKVVAPEAVAPAIDALIADLENGDDFVRAEAAKSLGNFGPQAERAAPALLKSLVAGNSGIPYGPYAAADALDQIGPAALTDGLLVLAQNLRNHDEMVRKNSADTLRPLVWIRMMHPMDRRNTGSGYLP
jgi:HEAT repeat protein